MPGLFGVSRVRHCAVLVACIMACAGPSQTPPAALKTEFVDGIILVDAVLSGVHGWWLLDTGYECSVLDSAVARARGIATSSPEKTAAPGGAINQASTRGLILGISGEVFRPESVAVLPVAPLSPIVGRPITGILGHDFFAHHIVTVDYAKRDVLVLPADRRPELPGAAILALWIEAGETFVEGTLWVAGRTVPAKLKLDTGSLSGLGLNGSFVAQNRLFPDDWPRRPVEGIAVGGATRNFVARADSLRFGGTVIPSPVAGWSEDLSRVGDAGTVGAPVLARFRITFDYPHHLLHLEPRSDAQHRERWEATGMILAQIPDGDVIVFQVIPGTPADSSGIVAGDILRRVNGQVATSLGLDALRTHFRQPGRLDTLVVARNGRERSLKLHQTDMP